MKDNSTRLTRWNKDQLVAHFEFFLDLCYEYNDKEHMHGTSAYIGEWQSFFARTDEEIAKFLQNAERVTPSRKQRKLTEKQRKAIADTNRKEERFYKKWSGTKYESLFFDSPFNPSSYVESGEIKGFASIEEPIRNELWDSFVEEFGHTPVEEVDKFFGKK